MDDMHLRLIQRAIEIHKKIYPCGDTTQLKDCFTIAENKLFFWFNTEDNNTHVVEESLSNKDS